MGHSAGNGVKMMKFGYEDLEVWNRAVDFAVSIFELSALSLYGGDVAN
jgi:hypothetical protein